MASKSHINKIGEILVANSNINDALQELSEWRSTHIYALNQAFKIIKKKADKVGNNAIYGQRLKRINSIITKLTRFNTRLSSMQDIGGCRVIFKDFNKVYSLFLELQKSKSIKELKNYIFAPKNDGYRGIHLLYTLKSKNAEHNGLNIEIQLRTIIQHAWATTLEVVDFFENQDMKIGKGSQEWKRFFYLAAEEFAMLERLPLHDNTINAHDRRKELLFLILELNIYIKLSNYIIFIKLVDLGKINVKHNYIVININSETSVISTQGFKNFNEAKEYHFLLEKEQIGVIYSNTLLVETKSLKDLKKAYPNYFGDTQLFLEYLKSALKST
jgi:putative GTP pyrophosphokinase